MWYNNNNATKGGGFDVTWRVCERVCLTGCGWSRSLLSIHVIDMSSP